MWRRLVLGLHETGFGQLRIGEKERQNKVLQMQKDFPIQYFDKSISKGGVND